MPICTVWDGGFVGETVFLNVGSSNRLKSYRFAAPSLKGKRWSRRLEDIELGLPEGAQVGIKLQCTVDAMWLQAVSRCVGSGVRLAGRGNEAPSGAAFALGTDPAAPNCHMRPGRRPRSLKSRRLDLSVWEDRDLLARELLAVEFLGCAKGIVADESCAMHVHVSLPEDPSWDDYLDAMSGSGPADVAAQQRLSRAVDELVRPSPSGRRFTMGDACDRRRSALGRDGTETARFGDGFNYARDTTGNYGFRAITRHDTMEFRLGSSSWCAAENVSWLGMAVSCAELLFEAALFGPDAR